MTDEEPRSLSVEILKQIRAEVRSVKTELHSVKTELHSVKTELSARIDELRSDTNERFEEMEHQITESEIRTATAITELAGNVRELTIFFRKQSDLHPRVERCERDITELRAQQSAGD